MPVQLSYPGVYLEEVPSGVRTITGVSTSVTGFIGRASRGPVHEAVLVTSFADYERIFGGLWQNGTLGYAVRDFFLNGGSQAVVVRAYKGAADFKTGAARLDKPIAISGKQRDGAGTESAAALSLQLYAASAGTWGNQLSVALSFSNDFEAAQRLGVAVAQLQTIEVRLAGDVVEVHRSLTMVESPRRIDRVLAQVSKYLRAEITGATGTVSDAPAVAAAATPLAAGADSAALDLATYRTALAALDKNDSLNLLCIPPDTRGGDTGLDVYKEAQALCVRRRAMLLIDSPAAWVDTAAAKAGLPAILTALGGPAARNVALYFPRVLQSDPLRGGQVDEFNPSGGIAGVLASTDAQRGIWKSPAGLDAALSGLQGLDFKVTDSDSGELNPLGINCLRIFPQGGAVIWGARTLRGSDSLADDYKYLAVRRLALYIEESLYRGTQWAVFEPNDEPLWAQLRLNIGVFMQSLFRKGAFKGQSSQEAYFVKCDRETTTQADIDQGIVNIVVGFAPLKPAEFVVIRLQQITEKASP